MTTTNRFRSRDFRRSGRTALCKKPISLFSSQAYSYFLFATPPFLCCRVHPCAKKEARVALATPASLLGETIEQNRARLQVSAAWSISHVNVARQSQGEGFIVNAQSSETRTLSKCLLEPELLFIVYDCRRPNAGGPAAAVCGTTGRRVRIQVEADGRVGGLLSNV